MGSVDGHTAVVPDGGTRFHGEFHDESPVQAIVFALAELEDCSVTDVPPLYRTVDTNAMERLLLRARDEQQDVTVRVTVEEYAITICSDGTITILDRES